MSRGKNQSDNTTDTSREKLVLVYLCPDINTRERHDKTIILERDYTHGKTKGPVRKKLVLALTN